MAAGMNSVVNAIVGDWQTSGVATFKGGFPLRINVDNLNPFGVGQNVNVVGDYHVSNQTVNQWFNTAAFVASAAIGLSEMPHGISLISALRVYNNWDMSIQKYFPVTEQVRFQFRLDMFNAFNHVNFYKPDTNLGSGTFGHLTARL